MATITINFFDSNDNMTSFSALQGETFAQVLGHDDVQAWFEASPDYEAGDNILDSIVEINDADVEGNAAVIEMLLRAAVQDGDSITFDFVAATAAADEGLDNAINGGAAASGSEGVVIVSISGGLQTARINITNGVATIRDVIFNDTVRARSGMSDTQLREATVMYKGQLISYNQMDSVRVNDADIIELAPRVAATKG
jgi:hypothetical protein